MHVQTGHVHGLSEITARTPVMGQLESQQLESSLLAARRASPTATGTDPCNEAVEIVSKKAAPVNLWPHLQKTGMLKPGQFALRCGDCKGYSCLDKLQDS